MEKAAAEGLVDAVLRNLRATRWAYSYCSVAGSLVEKVQRGRMIGLKPEGGTDTVVTLGGKRVGYFASTVPAG